MIFTLLHPSRGRAAQALQVRNRWLERSSGKYKIEHILGIDDSDAAADQYKELFKGDQSIIVQADNDTVVEATNNIAKAAGGHILIYLSDDFDCPENWDQKIIDSVNRIVPDTLSGMGQPLWLLKVDDMLQPMWKDVLTIPIMSASLYRALGYFWHPGYRSMFVDQHLYHRVKKMGHLYADESLKFEHKHPSVGKAVNDETYKRSAANWNQGLQLYKQHQKEGFIT